MEVKIGLKTLHVTSREIDTLACLLNGRGIKKTAQLLGISPKTVDGHVRNLMLKLECNGREAIIDRLEHSDILEIIKARYHQLLDLTPGISREKEGDSCSSSSLPSVDAPEASVESGPCSSHLSVHKVPLQKNPFVKKLLGLGIEKLTVLKDKRRGWLGGLFVLSCFSGALLIKILPPTDKSVRLFIKSEGALPHPEVFLSRPDLLERMREKLKEKEGIQKLVLLGGGGSGKTTLARYYMQGQSPPLSWEINAEGAMSLVLSLSQLAQALVQEKEDIQALREIQTLKDFSQKEEKLLAYLKNKLRKRPGWILLFDNVVNFSDIKKYLPADFALWGSGKIIITTQNATVGLHDYIRTEDIVEVGELTAEKKEELFKKILHSSSIPADLEDSKQLKNFLEKLPPFPLDISTAAYYIKLTTISYSQYLKRMEASYEDFSEIQQSILKEVSHYAKTRYGIISLSLQSIMQISSDFTDLLILMSLLDSYHIPQALLEVCKPALIVDKFIYHLKKYSLITQESLSPTSGSHLSLHRSTQEVSLAYLTKALDLENKLPLIQALATCIDTYLSELIKQEDISKMKGFIPHGEKFLSNTSLVTEQMRGVLESKLGGIYFYLGYYPQAKRNLEKSLQILQTDEKKNYEMVLWTLKHLSDVHNDIGDYKEAQALLEYTLELYKKQVPSQEARMVGVLERLGNVHNGRGHYAQARHLLEQALDLCQKHLPQAHEGRARTLARLAITYRELGEFSKALALDHESLSLYKKYFSYNKVRLARQLASLGYTYQCLGDNTMSQKLLEESLILYKKELPPEHIYTTWASIFLGNTYKQLGHYEKARDLLERGLSICQKHYGPHHVKVAEVLRDLGDLYVKKNELMKGEKLLLKSLDIFRYHHHPHAYTSLERLAELYKNKLDQQKNKESMSFQEAVKRAFAYLEEALKILQVHFPPASPHTLRLQDKLGQLTKELKEE